SLRSKSFALRRRERSGEGLSKLPGRHTRDAARESGCAAISLRLCATLVPRSAEAGQVEPRRQAEALLHLGHFLAGDLVSPGTGVVKGGGDQVFEDALFRGLQQAFINGDADNTALRRAAD